MIRCGSVGYRRDPDLCCFCVGRSRPGQPARQRRRTWRVGLRVEDGPPPATPRPVGQPVTPATRPGGRTVTSGVCMQQPKPGQIADSGLGDERGARLPTAPRSTIPEC
jgi:hypothetical protein